MFPAFFRRSRGDKRTGEKISGIRSKQIRTESRRREKARAALARDSRAIRTWASGCRRPARDGVLPISSSPSRRSTDGAAFEAAQSRPTADEARDERNRTGAASADASRVVSRDVSGDARPNHRPQVCHESPESRRACFSPNDEKTEPDDARDGIPKRGRTNDDNA